MRDDVEGLRRAANVVETGDELWRSWVRDGHGTLIAAAGGQGRANVPPHLLAEVEKIRERYHSDIGTPVSVGIGTELSEAEKALRAAQKRGGNRTLIYSQELDRDAGEEGLNKNERVLQAVMQGDINVVKELLAGVTPLEKGFSGPKAPSIREPAAPAAEASPHSQNDALYDLLHQAAENQPDPPEQTHAAEDFEQMFHQAAQGQEQKDMAQVQVDWQRTQALKQQIGGLLMQLRDQAPVIEQLKGQIPKVYQAVQELADAVTEMARELTTIQQTQMKKSEQPLRKDLASIPKGREIGAGVYDYSHLLSPGHRQAGYSLVVHHGAPATIPAPQKPGIFGRLMGKKPVQPPVQYGSKGPVNTRAQLLYQGKVVGGIDATQNQKSLRIGESIIKDPAHRGGGKGTAMYEALMAHAKNVGGAKYAFGDVHSSMASAVHQRLAARHGLEYSAQANPRTATAPAGPYDKKFLPYSYDLKSEMRMTKADFADLLAAPPPEIGIVIEQLIKSSDGYEDDWYDHSHLVPQGLEGYEILTTHNGRQVESEVRYNGDLVGTVNGLMGREDHTLWVDQSDLSADHRGKGLGQAMYRAMYDHASEHLGARYAGGSAHTRDAAKMHRRLSHEYSAQRNYLDDYRPYGEYHYRLSSIRKNFRHLPMPRAAAHHHLQLPVGTTIEGTGRFLTQRPDGKKVWKQARVGMIMSREPATAGADYGHATSSRQPNT